MYNVEYTPSVPGDYKISITCGENHIPGQIYFYEKQLRFSFILFTLYEIIPSTRRGNFSSRYDQVAFTRCYLGH